MKEQNKEEAEPCMEESMKIKSESSREDTIGKADPHISKPMHVEVYNGVPKHANIILYYIFRKLGLGELKPTTNLLQFANLQPWSTQKESWRRTSY